jgi:hypothetical protein
MAREQYNHVSLYGNSGAKKFVVHLTMMQSVEKIMNPYINSICSPEVG